MNHSTCHIVPLDLHFFSSNFDRIGILLWTEYFDISFVLPTVIKESEFNSDSLIAF